MAMRGTVYGILFLAGLLEVSGASGAITTWTGSGDGFDWFNGLNWNNGAPSTGDTAIIVSGNVRLTNDTAPLSSFVITNATLTFSNWYATLTATNVNIRSGATISLPPAFVDGQMSNRIHIVCSNFTLDVGGLVNADAKGYAGATVNNGYGPGKGVLRHYCS